MPSIKLPLRNEGPFHGPAEGEYGVFTDEEYDEVFAGSHRNGFGRIGVFTDGHGKVFLECDADGRFDGRFLAYYADGREDYTLYEHGKWKGNAQLRADGTCHYFDQSWKACSADFPPFVALKAEVLPIKARPAAHSPQPPSRIRPTHPAPIPIHPSAMFWHSQELAETHAEKVRAGQLLRPA
jgi:hypothetical protein